jgi:hypothetical protein
MSDKNCKTCYDCGASFGFFRRKQYVESFSLSLSLSRFFTLLSFVSCSCSSQTIEGKMYNLKGSVRVCNHCYELVRIEILNMSLMSAPLSVAATTPGSVSAQESSSATTSTPPLSATTNSGSNINYDELSNDKSIQSSSSYCVLLSFLCAFLISLFFVRWPVSLQSSAN